MIELGAATENDMVAAFLRAEINSSRFDEFLTSALARTGFTRQLIDQPNLEDAAENWARKQLLDFRGYRNREALFTGFPHDAVWRRVVLEEKDLQALRYANYPTWKELSKSTRLVAIGAQNFRQQPDSPETYHINGIVEALRNGTRFPELIAAQDNDGGLILIEGHSRATAYLMEQFGGDVEVLVAVSPAMRRWAFYSNESGPPPLPKWPNPCGTAREVGRMTAIAVMMLGAALLRSVVVSGEGKGPEERFGSGDF